MQSLHCENITRATLLSWTFFLCCNLPHVTPVKLLNTADLTQGATQLQHRHNVKGSSLQQRCTEVRGEVCGDAQWPPLRTVLLYRTCGDKCCLTAKGGRIRTHTCTHTHTRRIGRSCCLSAHQVGSSTRTHTCTHTHSRAHIYTYTHTHARTRVERLPLHLVPLLNPQLKTATTRMRNGVEF